MNKRAQDKRHRMKTLNINFDEFYKKQCDAHHMAMAILPFEVIQPNMFMANQVLKHKNFLYGTSSPDPLITKS